MALCLWSLAKAPVALDNERIDRLNDNDTTIEILRNESAQLRAAIAKPKRSPSQQHYYEKTQEAIQNGGEKIKAILGYFHRHKRVRVGSQLGAMAQHLGFSDISKLAATLRQLRLQDIIVEIPDISPTGEVTWELPAVMESVLEELLY
jgi:hypothetical protein